MTWHPIRRNENGEGTPFVRLGSTRRKEGNAYAQMFLTISVSIAQFLGLREGDRVKIDLGQLADQGLARISKGKEQKATRFGHRGSIRVRFSGRHLGVKDSNPPTDLKYNAERGASGTSIMFPLPAWARQNEVKDGA